MRPAEVVRRATEFLARHDVESPRATAETLMMAVLGTDRAAMYARADGLDAREARMFGRAICQRCAGTPLQHLTGEQAFRGITLEVRPGVFVPRPETEVLVGLALADSVDVDAPVVVDVGTGTGAIALAIKTERPDARVFATDVSPAAVDLARANAERLGLDVTIVRGDLFDGLPGDLRGRVDLVASNPPYVTVEGYEDLPVDVRADPLEALLGGPDVFRGLARDATGWLRGGALLALEIGADQGADVAEILRRDYVDVEIRRDLADRDRVVLARRP